MTAALLPYLFLLLVIVLLIAAAVSNAKKANSTAAPQMQIWARIIRIAPMQEPNSEEFCEITFEDAACKRFVLTVPSEICNTVTEGSIGSLCYQGRTFFSFTPLSFD